MVGINLSLSKTVFFREGFGEYTSWYMNGGFAAQYGVETASIRPQAKTPQDDFFSVAKGTSTALGTLQINPIGACMRLRLGIDGVLEYNVRENNDKASRPNTSYSQHRHRQITDEDSNIETSIFVYYDNMIADVGNDKNPTNNVKPSQAAINKKGTIDKTKGKPNCNTYFFGPILNIGSIERVEENMWLYDIEKETMVQKQISYIPGLYKIFDKVLVNAADNKQRDKTMDCIKIEINEETNLLSVWNNGQGIPITIHKDEKMYVLTTIFGHLLTSSNYKNEEQKVTGGRNEYGDKLCNIFSAKFIVETGLKEHKRQFDQTLVKILRKLLFLPIYPSSR
ncbi:hypothetical protein FQA39_LY01578 [Lamprigera yunnana]|nr:hypothetical protein FQA39_LY01578 [Lamprigera yunnana]